MSDSVHSPALTSPIHDPFAVYIQHELAPVLTEVRNWLSWLPAPVVSFIVLSVIGLLAALFSRLVTDRILMRIPGAKRGALVRLFTKSLRRPVRLMVMLFAVGITLPVSGLSNSLQATIGHILLICFIATMG